LNTEQTIRRRIFEMLKRIDASLEERDGVVKFAKSSYDAKDRIEFYSETGRECLLYGSEWVQDRCRFYHIIYDRRYRLFHSIPALYSWLQKLIELLPYQQSAQIRADVEQQVVFVVRSSAGLCVHTHAEIMTAHSHEQVKCEFTALPRPTTTEDIA
jgi:hypothetical protein